MADGVTSPRGAEISERSVELVLPDDDAGATPLRKRREFGVSESEGTTAQILRERATNSCLGGIAALRSDTMRSMMQ